ncbi:MAG: creatininase family protein [Desulfobacterota bacterium]|jgi:creatinine amidohydrolase|nr:creatininase family protein [Thermodesulfobacteriota bacterium]
MLLEAMTMEEFRISLERSRTALVPVGSVEEHGAHLPLGTDTIHAFEVCRAAGERTGALVVPPVYYGVCRSTSQHPGTLGISGDTLRALLRDIGLALYHQGLRNLIFLSGHAGGTHTAALVEAGEQLLDRLPEVRVAALNILDLGAGGWAPIIETKGDSHAGELETSVMMTLRPSWVKGTSPEEYPHFPKAILVRNKVGCWPGGVWGDPSKASPEKGAACLEAVTLALVDLIRGLESWKE